MSFFYVNDLEVYTKALVYSAPIALFLFGIVKIIEGIIQIIKDRRSEK